MRRNGPGQQTTVVNAQVLLTDSSLESFGSNLNVAVIGSSGGLGGALTEHLIASSRVSKVFALSRQASPSAHIKQTSVYLDLEKSESIEAAVNTVQQFVGTLNLVIIAAGILHDGPDMQPERSLESITVHSLERAFRVNTIAPALVAKHFLPLLVRDKKSAFAALSARVGSISDNRLGGWHSYRASKAALNMLIRTFSIELGRQNPSAVCVALHPGTVDTKLSRPFQRNVPMGSLKPASESAKNLLAVLGSLSPKESGGFFAWDGSRIPY